MRSCVRTVICIDSECFDNIGDAVKYLMRLASCRRPVTITRRTDARACLLAGNED